MVIQSHDKFKLVRVQINSKCVEDSRDNCPLIANPDQEDLDDDDQGVFLGIMIPCELLIRRFNPLRVLFGMRSRKKAR